MDHVGCLCFLFPSRLPNQVRGLKALYKRVVIHREINSHETCEALARKGGPLTKITVGFLWGLLRVRCGEQQSVEGSRHQPFPRQLGGLRGRVYPPVPG